MRFAQRLKQLRKELDINQDELARACGVKLTAISKYENEIIKPGFDMLSKIGFAYNVNLNWLINEIGSMFIETSTRRLVRNGTDSFTVLETENVQVVNEVKHSLNLTSDLKVDYYGVDDANYTKIYRANGEIDYIEPVHSKENIEVIVSKLVEICNNQNKFDFVLTAINSIEDKEALKELKTMIKGMEINN